MAMKRQLASVRASWLPALIIAAGCAAPDQVPVLAAAEAPVARWETVWSDDFNGTKLDPARWQAEESCWGGGNNERQCYTGRPENIRVENGLLHLIARPESYTGSVHADEAGDPQAETITRAYTSGKVRTHGLASWKYGRISARIKLPPGLGAWSAFWMMPEGDVYGSWPLSGEIDIMEAINLGAPCAECEGGIERRTSGALHFGGLYPKNTYLYLKTSGARTTGPHEEFRTYSIEWAEGIIQWLVDGRVFMRIRSEDWGTESPVATGRPHAPFDQPFYAMLNLAVGGNLAEKSVGGGFDPSTFPAQMLVDWVRVEQCANDPQTGLGCLTAQDWSGLPMGPWENAAP